MTDSFFEKRYWIYQKHIAIKPINGHGNITLNIITHYVVEYGSKILKYLSIKNKIIDKIDNEE